MSETIDQQFIEYIVKALVGNADAVKITRTIDERGVLLELYVDPSDLGRVIGRNGSTAKSIRILLRALGVKNDARYNLKIVDTNGGGRSQEDRQDGTGTVVEPTDTVAEEVAATSGEESPPEASADDTEIAAAGDSSDDGAAAVDDQAPNNDTVASDTEEKEEEKEDDLVARSRKDLEDLTDLDI